MLEKQINKNMELNYTNSFGFYLNCPKSYLVLFSSLLSLCKFTTILLKGQGSEHRFLSPLYPELLLSMVKLEKMEEI